MFRHTWIHALALVAVATFVGARVDAAEVRDRAGMFSADTVRKAGAELDRIERKSGIPIVIETIESLPGLERDASSERKRKAVEQIAETRAREIPNDGAYLLISREDHVFSELLVRGRYKTILPRAERQAVRDALISEFKANRFDGGLLRATQILDRALDEAPVAARPINTPVVPAPRRGQANGGGFGIGALLVLGLGIFGVLVLFRVLGNLLGRGGGYAPGPGMGGMLGQGMGPGPGYGPGYGYGYGPPRGGFLSGMLGGLGGALAGNWLYDQFSGRHGSSQVDASSYAPGEAPASYDPGDDAFVGGDNHGGMGASWDDSSGTDGGGDWGGGDGGGDWGGGGDDGGGW